MTKFKNYFPFDFSFQSLSYYNKKESIFHIMLIEFYVSTMAEINIVTSEWRFQTVRKYSSQKIQLKAFEKQVN